jgi:hypothetical protein|tara:strand:- start:1301 stop:1501 length:201 start_codon:yes stop_codon:yes gene_type:complete
MTYRELLEQLKRMSDEQLDLTATLKLQPWLEDAQYYPLDIKALDQEESEEELGCPDVPHPVLVADV